LSRRTRYELNVAEKHFDSIVSVLKIYYEADLDQEAFAFRLPFAILFILWKKISYRGYRAKKRGISIEGYFQHISENSIISTQHNQRGATMSKKDKKGLCLAENVQAVIDILPKLQSIIKAHKDIAEAYSMYRKNGGDEIPGIERHLGLKEQICEHCEKTEKKEKKGKKKDQ
jgi:hypothetical protein